MSYVLRLGIDLRGHSGHLGHLRRLLCLPGWDSGDIRDMDEIFFVLEMHIWSVDWMVGTFAT
jgi:hypothetical protein